MTRSRPARILIVGCVSVLTAASLVSVAASALAAPASCPGLGNQTTRHRPGLAAFNGSMFMSWTGTNGNGWGNLNFISTPDGTCYSSKTVSVQTSVAGPALAVYNGKLWAAYTAVNSAHNLCLMSSTDGVHWSSPTVFTAESSMASPALAAFNGVLYLAWTGTDHAQQGYGHLFMLATTDGVRYTKHEFTGDTAPEFAGPGLTVFTGTSTYLELAWAGTNTPSTTWVFQSQDGTNWINHTNSQVGGQLSPSITPDPSGGLDMVDMDNNFQLQFYQSSDGLNFGSGQMQGDSNTDATLATMGNGVWLGETYLSSQSQFQLALGRIR